MSVVTLADLLKSPERKVFEAYVAMLRTDTIFSAVFRPILMLETPKFESMLTFPVNTMVIQPTPPKPEDHPSKRQTSKLAVWVSFYLPWEPTEEDSLLYGLDLGGYLRQLSWGVTFFDPAHPAIAMNFATTEFKQLATHAPVGGSTRILSYEVKFELDVNPKLNDFSTS